MRAKDYPIVPVQIYGSGMSGALVSRIRYRPQSSKSLFTRSVIPYVGLALIVMMPIALFAFAYWEAQPASGASIRVAGKSGECSRTMIENSIDMNHSEPLSNGALRIVEEMCAVMAANEAAKPEKDRLLALQRSALVN